MTWTRSVHVKTGGREVYKDENSSQEKEASESEEKVKIEKQEKTLGKQKNLPFHPVKECWKGVKRTLPDGRGPSTSPHASPPKGIPDGIPWQ